MREAEIWAVRVSSWEQAKAVGGQLHSWLFRGQRESTWDLSSTLERELQPTELHTRLLEALLSDRKAQLLRYERVLVREFQRRAYSHLRHVPSDSQLIDWLSLMQHFGCPTRLVDFSYSFYVAAYFAVETPSELAAVWCLDPTCVYSAAKGTASEDEDGCNGNGSLLPQVLAGKATERGLFAAEPHRFSERIAVQQGVHLMSVEASAPFEANLAASLGRQANSLGDLDWRKYSPEELVEKTAWHSVLVPGLLPPDENPVRLLKIELPGEVQVATLWDLNRMNVNGASLFPGLSGFARSLSTHTRYITMADAIREGKFREKVLAGSKAANP